MNNIKEYILEKILINKDTVLDYKPDDKKRYVIYCDSEKIDFPVILNIGDSKIECAFYMIREKEGAYTFYDFYDAKFNKIVSLSEGNLLKVFDRKETITTNTKLGWKQVKYIK